MPLELKEFEEVDEFISSLEQSQDKEEIKQILKKLNIIKKILWPI